MGLDQIACARRGKPQKGSKRRPKKENSKGAENTEKKFEWRWKDQYEFAVWRNHSSLQYWMENKWIKKKRPVIESDKDSYEEDVFNNVDLKLTKKDILELREAVSNGKLFETYGFILDDETSKHFKKADLRYKKADLHFIENALEYLKRGYDIIYSSSW